ncbi:MAG: hypothetical protein ABEI97_03105, partial [Candidatus Nanohaloarchaea archaeon]
MTALLVIAGIGTAAVLGAYGTLTGTADVHAAVVVDSYDTTADNVTVRNNANVSVDGIGDDLRVNVSDKASRNVTATLAVGETHEIDYSVDINGSDTRGIRVNGTTNL